MSDVLGHFKLSEPGPDDRVSRRQKAEQEQCDRDAFYFLTALLIIIVTFAIFKAEILSFIASNFL
jgi:hypothetical protein